MKVAVLKETFPGERRVALSPGSIGKLVKQGLEIQVEAGAGESAGFLDADYSEAGAIVVADRPELLTSDILLYVRTLGANPTAGRADLPHYREPIVIGLSDPLGAPSVAQELATANATLFSLELIPRITRAQSMDVLSSQATIAGYRAVLLAAAELPKMFPLMMTAAGTITAAKVFVIGAGVAGLQAIATARRLGAIVHAYDVRPACREQVESLGGKFVELPLDTGQSEDKGGYAKAMGDEFYVRQRELLADFIADCDVVISTAAIPGKPSPLLITEDAVRRMPAGGVVVDLAAERGGNCELSKPDERVEAHHSLILGPTNLPSEIPYHASQMFSNNMTRFLLNLLDSESHQPHINLEDEIIRDTLVTRGGEVVHARIRQLLDMPPLESNSEESSATDPKPADAPPQSTASADEEPIKVDLYADEEADSDEVVAIDDVPRDDQEPPPREGA